jgi:hypothetical protein
MAQSGHRFQLDVAESVAAYKALSDGLTAQILGKQRD